MIIIIITHKFTQPKQVHAFNFNEIDNNNVLDFFLNSFFFSSRGGERGIRELHGNSGQSLGQPRQHPEDHRTSHQRQQQNRQQSRRVPLWEDHHSHQPTRRILQVPSIIQKMPHSAISGLGESIFLLNQTNMQRGTL